MSNAPRRCFVSNEAVEALHAEVARVSEADHADARGPGRTRPTRHVADPVGRRATLASRKNRGGRQASARGGSKTHAAIGQRS